MDYVWDETREDILFWGTESDLEQLNSVISKCLEVLEKSTNVREIVMEAWLAVDYALRKFLLAGFELSRFCDEDFELEYELLPNSFHSLLQLFKTVLNHNRKLGVSPEPRLPDKIGGFRSSHEFWSYIKEKHPKLHQSILQVTDEYRLEKNPELKKLASNERVAFISLERSESKVKRMEIGWTELASKFDDEWIEKARRLNAARNRAAHSYDIEKICHKLGIRGADSLEETRTECKQLLNVLLAVRTNN